MFRQSPIFYLAEKIDDTLTKFCEENIKSKSSDFGGGGPKKNSVSSGRETFAYSTMVSNNSNYDNGPSIQYSKEKDSVRFKNDNDENDRKYDSSGYSSREETPLSSREVSISDSGEKKLEFHELSKELNKMTLNSRSSGHPTPRRNNRNSYYKKYQVPYYPNVTKSYLTSLSKFPQRYITERCICNAEDACTYYKLRGTSLKECHCRSHHRFIPNNIRVKMETSIIQHILKNLLDRPVKILSLGSGAYLQDLMIILRLAEGGMKSIHISMVEPNPCNKAYPDFTFFLDKIKNIYEMKEITVRNYTDINQVDTKEAFDVIYAIDFDECNSKEYLLEHRHIEVHNNETQSSDPDKPTWDLIEASKLLTSEEHGLIIASKCKHILHKTPDNFPFYGMP